MSAIIKGVNRGVNLAAPYDDKIPNKDQNLNTQTISVQSNGLEPSTSGGGEAEIRMRCPSCYKLYTVDPQTIYVDKPEFDCVSCSQRFWISFPEALEHSEIVAFPIEWSEQFKSEISLDEILNVEPTLDPELVEKITKNFSEVIQDPAPEKTSGIRKVGFVDDVETELNSEFWFLEKSWEKVLNNYDTKAVHKEFIHSARAKQSLDFALGKYKNFCEANSQDSMAKEMRTYCEKLIQDFAIHKSVLGNESKGLKSYLRFLPWAVLSTSAAMIGLGLSDESLSWLAGIGFALIFVTGALSLLKESDL